MGAVVESRQAVSSAVVSDRTIHGASRLRRRAPEALGLVARRLAVAVPIVVLVSLGVFWLSSHSPFDPLTSFLGDRAQTTSLERQGEMRQALGLDRSWWRAWLAWAGDLLRGDLGHSRYFRMSVARVVGERLPWTLLLSATGIALALLASVVGGIWAGLRTGSLVDRLASGVAVLLSAVPSYVVSLGVIVVFSLGLGWFPAGGLSAPGQPLSAGGVVRHLALPAAALACSLVPWLLLSVRASVRRALASDAVHGAIARGLSPRTIITRHVLPVSLAPLVTLVGVRLPELVVGAVLVEEVFGWPGLAQATVASAQHLDFDLLAALTIATTALVLLGSLLADAVNLVLDPRVEP